MLTVTDGLTIPAEDIVLRAVRASGPGGQNVNKVATAVELRFDVRRSRALADAVAVRLIRLAGRKVSKDGILVLQADRHRTREMNRQDALDRLADMIRAALKPPPPKRRPTRPTQGAVERRLKGKARRGAVKQLRGRADDT